MDIYLKIWKTKDLMAFEDAVDTLIFYMLQNL